jgi:SH3-like domain-containing protein
MTLRAFFLVIILLLHSPSLFAGTETFPFLAEVKSDKVNIRAGQSPNFEPLGLLKRGDTIIVVAKEYSWYKVRLPKTAKSFISEKYVKLLSDQEGEITGSRVNVRAAANVNNTALAQLSAGSKVKIVQKKEDWYQIEPVEDSFGWVAQELLEFKTNDFATENVVAAENNVLPDVPVQEVKVEKKEKVVLKKEPVAISPEVKKSSEVKKWVQSKVEALKKEKSSDNDVAKKELQSTEKTKDLERSAKSKKKTKTPKPKSEKKSSVEEKTVSLMGILKPALPPISPLAKFVLEVQGKPPYGVQGDKKELEKFLYSVVTIEGVVRSKRLDNSPQMVTVKTIAVVSKKE